MCVLGGEGRLGGGGGGKGGGEGGRKADRPRQVHGVDPHVSRTVAGVGSLTALVARRSVTSSGVSGGKVTHCWSAHLQRQRKSFCCLCQWWSDDNNEEDNGRREVDSSLEATNPPQPWNL